MTVACKTEMNFHAELKMMHQINHGVNETHKYEQPALSGWNEKEKKGFTHNLIIKCCL